MTTVNIYEQWPPSLEQAHKPVRSPQTSGMAQGTRNAGQPSWFHFHHFTIPDLSFAKKKQKKNFDELRSCTRSQILKPGTRIPQGASNQLVLTTASCAKATENTKVQSNYRNITPITPIWQEVFYARCCMGDEIQTYSRVAENTEGGAAVGRWSVSGPIVQALKMIFPLLPFWLSSTTKKRSEKSRGRELLRYRMRWL